MLDLIEESIVHILGADSGARCNAEKARPERANRVHLVSCLRLGLELPPSHQNNATNVSKSDQLSQRRKFSVLKQFFKTFFSCSEIRLERIKCTRLTAIHELLKRAMSVDRIIIP